VCAKCSSYQRAIKNHLRYAAQVIGVVAIICSAMVYVAGAALTLYHTISPRDRLLVLGASTAGDVVLANAGDRRITVSRVFFNLDVPEGRQSRSQPIQEVVDPGQVLHYDPWKRRNIGRNLPTGKYVNGAPSDAWSQILSRAIRGDPCFVLDTMSVVDPEYLRLREFVGSSLNSIRARGSVEFYAGSESAPRRAEFEAVGVVGRVISDQCHEPK
jgi:hypothetical protein